MSNTAIFLIVIWTIVLLILQARLLNDFRVIHNNIAPEAADMNYMKPGIYYRWWGFRFSSMDPEKLTKPGRERLAVAMWNERATWLWMAIGFLSAPFVVG